MKPNVLTIQMNPDAPSAASMPMANLVANLMHSRTIAHLEHLATRSYAKHKALEDYYTAIVGLVDTLVETYQGSKGFLPAPTSDFQYVRPFNMGAYLQSLRAAVVSVRSGLEPHLQNIVDEITALIDQTLYKFQLD